MLLELLILCLTLISLVFMYFVYKLYNDGKLSEWALWDISIILCFVIIFGVVPLVASLYPKPVVEVKESK